MTLSAPRCDWHETGATGTRCGTRSPVGSEGWSAVSERLAALAALAALELAALELAALEVAALEVAALELAAQAPRRRRHGGWWWWWVFNGGMACDEHATVHATEHVRNDTRATWGRGRVREH